MDDIFTFLELQELTGYKTSIKVREWLIKNHIPFILARNNRPLVNRLALAFKMGVPIENKQKPSIQPNYEAI